MSGERRRGPIAVLRVLALSCLVGCAMDSTVDLRSDTASSPDYELGGQTGSLVPGCGLAPLSAEGSSVPTGSSLAVLYTKDCPGALARSSLALSGADRSDVTLTLVPLEGDGVYLVQADRRLSDGDYALSIGSDASPVTVGSAIAVPAQVGTLSAESSPEEECEDSLRFEMTDRATLAYAPIARFSVSIDGGEEQLWVDYGALPVTVAEQGSSAQFVLPRCGLTACLPEGRHQLRLRMDIAGVDAQPLPSQLDFYVRCPLPDTDLDSTTDSGSGCKLAAPSSGTLTALPALAALVSAFLGRRRRANPSAAP